MASPTGGAIVLAAAVTLPKSIGRLRLSSRDPRAAPDIHYNFFDHPNDLDRLVEAVRLSRKIGRTAPFSDLIDHEMAPGNIADDGAALRANIVSTVAAYLHPTSTAPMGADSDPTAVVDAWGKVRGVEALRGSSMHRSLPDIPSVATNVTTIMGVAGAHRGKTLRLSRRSPHPTGGRGARASRVRGRNTAA